MRDVVHRLGQGLRFRISAAFLVVGLVLSTTLVGALDYALDIMDDRYVHTTLSENLELIIAQRREDPSVALPYSATLRAYAAPRSAEAGLPAALRGLEPGIHEIEGADAELQVLVRDDGAQRYVLTFDVTSLDRVEDDLDLALFAGIGMFSLLSLALGYWGAGRIIAPVRSLAEEVREITARAPEETVRLRGTWGDDEVGQLAQAFGECLARLQGFVRREKAFTADVSHELRNPIMVASSCLDILLQSPDPDAERQRRLLRMHRAIARMSELVDVFLALAREQIAPAEGAQPIHVCELEDMCRELLSRHEERAREKGLHVELQVAGEPMAAGSRSCARVVIDNLLSNAIRYTEAGTVRVCLIDGGIDIVDSGPGIALEDSVQIYERLYRGSNASGPGFGLGLNIVQRLCERNRWTMRLRNGEGGGAIAELRFAAA